jgi:hypothetical protein
MPTQEELRAKALKEQERVTLGLTPEAREAAQALEGRRAEKRRRFWWDLPSYGEYQVVPPPLQVQQDRDRQIAIALEVSTKRAKILESLAEVQVVDNPFKRAELTTEIVSKLWSANATVIAASTKATADVTRAEMSEIAALDKEKREVLDRQGMVGASPTAQSNLNMWKDAFETIIGNEAAYEKPGMEGGLQDDYVYQLANATSDAFLNQTQEDKRRMLSHMNAMLSDHGVMTVSDHIMGWRNEDPTLRVGSEKNTLLTVTEGFDIAGLVDSQRIAEINDRTGILRGEIADKVAKLDPKAAARLGQWENAFKMVSRVISPKDSKDPFAAYQRGLSDLDELIKDLKRPTYTEEWHRALDQLKHHPLFKDYMDLKGFDAGQESDAALQLVKDAGPTIARTAAAQRMMGSIRPEGEALGEKLPFVGPLLGPGPKSKTAEARRLALEAGMTPEQRKAGEDPSLRTQIGTARESAGLHPSQTIFQQMGVEPATRPKATKSAFGKEYEGPQGPQGQLSPAPGTRQGEEVRPEEEERPPREEALASMSSPTLVGGAQPPIDITQEGIESELAIGSPKRQKRLEAIQRLYA